MTDHTEEMRKKYNACRYYNADLMALVEHAKEQIADNREIEVVSQTDDEKLSVRLKAW